MALRSADLNLDELGKNLRSAEGELERFRLYVNAQNALDAADGALQEFQKKIEAHPEENTPEERKKLRQSIGEFHRKASKDFDGFRKALEEFIEHIEKSINLTEKLQEKHSKYVAKCKGICK